MKHSVITDEEYQRALDCWDESRCKTIKDYMIVYLKTEVLLSVDVFEIFRSLYLEYYKLDHCYTYSSPGLTWLCGFKYTDVKHKYYKEETVNIHDTVQKGTRGELASVLGNCHVKCKNKQNPGYPGKESYFKYIEVNSIYASTMIQALPTSETKICDKKIFTYL